MDFGKKYIIANITLIDGAGNEPLENMSLRVENCFIKEISKAAEMEVGDAEVYDFTGKTLMPGMIDSHIHLLGLHEFTTDELLGQNLVSATLRASTQAQAVLKRGVTSIRELSRGGLYLKRAIAQGILVGPRIISCGAGLSPTGGALDLAVMPPEIRSLLDAQYTSGYIVDGVDEVRKAVRMNLREGADQIKFFANGAEGSPVDKVGYKQFSREEVAAIIEEARRVPGTKVLAHLQEPVAAKECLELGVDTFEHLGYLDEEFCDEMVRQNKYLVPTLLLESTFDTDFTQNGEEMLTTDFGPFYQRDLYKKPSEDNRTEDVIKMFKMAHEKGVKIAVGSDCIDEVHTPYGEYTIQEICTLVKYGMTPIEAIKSACMTGSEVLGIEEMIGTLEPGKIADMIIVNGNPGENIEVLCNADNIEYVIQNGRAVVDHQKIII